VSEQYVIDVLNKLDLNKALGPDIIGNTMLLAVKNEVTKPLRLLFNKSFQCKIFPIFITFFNVVSSYAVCPIDV
jgi:hypothetical protein